MNWNRIHYTATTQEGAEVSGVIDVLSDLDHFDTFKAIRADVRANGDWVDFGEPIEVMPLPGGDGTLAAYLDPRDADLAAETGFPITVTKNRE